MNSIQTGSYVFKNHDGLYVDSAHVDINQSVSDVKVSADVANAEILNNPKESYVTALRELGFKKCRLMTEEVDDETN